MKKSLSFLLVGIMMLILISGCADLTDGNESISPTVPAFEAPSTPYEEEAPETAQISELGTYTIVYPSNYTDLRMDIVELLQNTIAHVTGVTPDVIPDTQESLGNEIVLASSARSTSLDETINGFASAMDYVVAVKDSKVILGGQNYWSDLRAVYDFIQNYLGYDDISNSHSAPANEISGVKIITHKKPSFFIQAATWATVFETAEQIKDVADANFNAIMYTVTSGSREKLHKTIGQCVRFEIYLVINRGAVMPELYTDCPVILGHNLWDEPRINEFSGVAELCEEYREKYSQYGWKAWVNHVGYYKYWEYMDEMWEWADADATGFDLYPWVESGRDHPALYSYEKAREITSLHDKDFWTYIQSYNHIGKPTLNTSKAYRWQMYYSMCFGTDGVIYFIYANQSEEIPWADVNSFVMSRGFIKNEQYYDAALANKDVAVISEICSDYEQVGAFVVNRKYDDEWSYFESPYDFGSVIEDIKDYKISDTYLVGCFDKKEGSGNAFIFMNINEPDSTPYSQTEITYVKAKINGQKITAYLNGEATVLEPDADGYYSLAAGNGICLFVTVE